MLSYKYNQKKEIGVEHMRHEDKVLIKAVV